MQSDGALQLNDLQFHRCERKYPEVVPSIHAPRSWPIRSDKSLLPGALVYSAHHLIMWNGSFCSARLCNQPFQVFFDGFGIIDQCRQIDLNIAALCGLVRYQFDSFHDLKLRVDKDTDQTRPALISSTTCGSSN